MSSNIQIKFLSLDEMANARDIDSRYENVGIDNLGFADKAKNRVFVRAGLESELTKLLIDHELNHLFELEGTDEDEHGIRHKKKGGFMKMFVPIVGAILGSILMPGVGSMLGGGLGSILGGATGVGLGAGLGGVAGSAATGKPNWLGNAIGGAGAGIGAGLGSALGGIGSTAGSSTGSGVGSTAGSTGSGAFGDIIGSQAGSFMPTLNSASGALANAGSLTGNIASGAGQAASSGIGKNIGALAGGTIGSLFSGALGQGQSAQGGYNPTSSSQSFKMPDLSQQSNANPAYSGWSDSIDLPGMGENYGASGYESLTNSRGMGGQAMMPMQVGLGQGGINLSGKDYSGGFGNKQMASGMDQMFNPSDPYGAASNFSF